MKTFSEYLTEALLVYNCPSCHAKLYPAVESMDHATQVVRRSCPKCGEKWQLVIKKLPGQRDDIRMDSADFTFLGRK